MRREHILIEMGSFWILTSKIRNPDLWADKKEAQVHTDLCGDRERETETVTEIETHRQKKKKEKKGKGDGAE